MNVTSIIAETTSSGSGGAAIVQLGIFLLIPVAMYFLLIRPQRRRQVMTTSGLYGFITGFDGDIVWLEIDDNVQIRVARAAVQRKVDTSAGDAGAAPTNENVSTDAPRSTPIADTGDAPAGE